MHKPNIAFIMLNPSTATAHVLDPTIRRCIGFAKQWDFGSLTVVNLFAFRTPSVQQLKQYAGDVIGPDNNRWIMQAAVGARKIVCAWGVHGEFMQRGRFITNWLQETAAFTLYRLGATVGNGQPRHPLYVPYTTGLEMHK